MSAEHYAKEAGRLLQDETLLQALSNISVAAKNEFVTVNADDKTAILRLQAKCMAIDELLTELESAILALGSPEQPAAS